MFGKKIKMIALILAVAVMFTSLQGLTVFAAEERFHQSGRQESQKRRRRAC